LNKLNTYSHLIQRLKEEGIIFQIIRGRQAGQHYGHEMVNNGTYEFVWRLDDDNFPESNVLEVLLSQMKEGVGAVAGLVLTPGAKELNPNFKGGYNDNIQWYKWKGVKEVEHLYSSFLYRSKVAHYELSLSKVAHREETIFSQRIKETGLKLLVVGDCITWHYRNMTGGIRNGIKQMWESDEVIFQELQRRKQGELIVYLDCGMGDHVCFNSIIPELENKYKNIRVFSCYPRLLNCESESLEVGKKVTLPDFHNIYKFMWDFNWKQNIVEAYRARYLN